MANSQAVSAALAADDENQANFPTTVSASTNSAALTPVSAEVSADGDGKQYQDAQPALTFDGLIDALLGTNSVRIPGHARLNVTYVKGNAYLRWRWHNRESGKQQVIHLGAFKPKRAGTKRISDGDRQQYNNQRATRGKRTNKRRG